VRVHGVHASVCGRTIIQISGFFADIEGHHDDTNTHDIFPAQRRAQGWSGGVEGSTELLASGRQVSAFSRLVLFFFPQTKC